nr:unnamed protein product [Digitaria exilis]
MGYLQGRHDLGPPISKSWLRPGYLAPELVRTGKATTLSDVFAFGPFVLEAACGRRPIKEDEDDMGGWFMLRKVSIAGAKDARLRLGLACLQPLLAARPSIAAHDVCDIQHIRGCDETEPTSMPRRCDDGGACWRTRAATNKSATMERSVSPPKLRLSNRYSASNGYRDLVEPVTRPLGHPELRLMRRRRGVAKKKIAAIRQLSGGKNQTSRTKHAASQSTTYPGPHSGPSSPSRACPRCQRPPPSDPQPVRPLPPDLYQLLRLAALDQPSSRCAAASPPACLLLAPRRNSGGRPDKAGSPVGEKGLPRKWEKGRRRSGWEKGGGGAVGGREGVAALDGRERTESPTFISHPSAAVSSAVAAPLAPLHLRRSSPPSPPALLPFACFTSDGLLLRRFPFTFYCLLRRCRPSSTTPASPPTAFSSLCRRPSSHPCCPTSPRHTRVPSPSFSSSGHIVPRCVPPLRTSNRLCKRLDRLCPVADLAMCQANNPRFAASDGVPPEVVIVGFRGASATGGLTGLYRRSSSEENSTTARSSAFVNLVFEDRSTISSTMGFDVGEDNIVTASIEDLIVEDHERFMALQKHIEAEYLKTFRKGREDLSTGMRKSISPHVSILSNARINFGVFPTS